MKNSRYSEEQIISMLKEHEAGLKTADLCHHGISPATLSQLRGGTGDASERSSGAMDFVYDARSDRMLRILMIEDTRAAKLACGGHIHLGPSGASRTHQARQGAR